MSESVDLLERDFARLLEIASECLDAIEDHDSIKMLGESFRVYEQEVSDMEVRAASGQYGARVRDGAR